MTGGAAPSGISRTKLRAMLKTGQQLTARIAFQLFRSASLQMEPAGATGGIPGCPSIAAWNTNAETKMAAAMRSVCSPAP